MLLIALALATSAPDLPASTADAAVICGALSGKEQVTPLEMSARSGYFALMAARENKGDGLVGPHIGVEATAIADHVPTADAALLPACHKRFPGAWVTRVTLPKDSFERRLACVIGSGFVVGLLQHLDDRALTQRYTDSNQRFTDMLSDEDFASHGVTSRDDAIALADKWLGGIVDLGNPLAIVATCEAAFPA